MRGVAATNPAASRSWHFQTSCSRRGRARPLRARRVFASTRPRRVGTTARLMAHRGPPSDSRGLGDAAVPGRRVSCPLASSRLAAHRRARLLAYPPSCPLPSRPSTRSLPWLHASVAAAAPSFPGDFDRTAGAHGKPDLRGCSNGSAGSPSVDAATIEGYGVRDLSRGTEPPCPPRPDLHEPRCTR